VAATRSICSDACTRRTCWKPFASGA
jgi:hypothetical protein